ACPGRWRCPRGRLDRDGRAGTPGGHADASWGRVGACGLRRHLGPPPPPRPPSRPRRRGRNSGDSFPCPCPFPPALLRSCTLPFWCWSTAFRRLPRPPEGGTPTSEGGTSNRAALLGFGLFQPVVHFQAVELGCQEIQLGGGIGLRQLLHALFQALHAVGVPLKGSDLVVLLFLAQRPLDFQAAARPEVLVLHLITGARTHASCGLLEELDLFAHVPFLLQKFLKGSRAVA